MNILLQYQEEVKKFNAEEESFDIVLNSSLVCLINWGDWHWGALNTNYKQIIEDVKFIKETPNLYAVINGDMLNNAIEFSHTGMRFEELTAPNIAKEVVKQIIEDLAGHILVVVSGDHDNWSFLMDDFKPAEYFAHHGKTHFFQWGGKINLTVNKIQYSIVARHRYYGNSRKNTNNAHENLWRESNADIIMLAHTHMNMIKDEFIEMDNRLKVFLNSGTYKRKDNFSQRGGYLPGQSVFPAVILSGEEKKAWTFNNFRDAVDFMNSKY